MISYPNIDPVFIRIGPLAFRWYGLMYALSFISAVFLIRVTAARKKFKITQDAISDLMLYAAIGVILGGRLGNFINGELYGRPTDVPWCMVFPQGGPACRHPSQLYQAGLEGVALFLILWTLSRKNLPRGVLFWSLVMFYGLFRFIVEFFREPDPQLGLLVGPFSMGQLLSFPMFLLGLIMVWIQYTKGRSEHPMRRPASS